MRKLHILKEQSQGLNFFAVIFFLIFSCLKPKLKSITISLCSLCLLHLILIGKDGGCCFKPSHSPGARFLFSILSARGRKNKLTDPLCVSQCHVNTVNFVPPCSIITRPAAICRLSGPAHTSCLISFRSGGAAGSRWLQADDFSEGSRAANNNEVRLRRLSAVVAALVSEQRRGKIGRKVARTRLTCYLQIRVCGLFMALQDVEESISPRVRWSRSPRWVLLRVS